MNLDKLTDQLFDWLTENRPVVKAQLREWLGDHVVGFSSDIEKEAANSKVEVACLKARTAHLEAVIDNLQIDIEELEQGFTAGFEDQIDTLSSMVADDDHYGPMLHAKPLDLKLEARRAEDRYLLETALSIGQRFGHVSPGDNAWRIALRQITLRSDNRHYSIELMREGDASARHLHLLTTWRETDAGDQSDMHAQWISIDD